MRFGGHWPGLPWLGLTRSSCLRPAGWPSPREGPPAKSPGGDGGAHVASPTVPSSLPGSSLPHPPIPLTLGPGATPRSPVCPSTDCRAVSRPPQPGGLFPPPAQRCGPDATPLCVTSVGCQPSCLPRTVLILTLNVPRPRKPLSHLPSRTAGVGPPTDGRHLQTRPCTAPHQEVVTGSVGVGWGWGLVLGEGLDSGYKSPPSRVGHMCVLWPGFLSFCNGQAPMAPP